MGGFLPGKHRRLVEFYKIKKPAMAGFLIFQNLIIIRDYLGTMIVTTKNVFCKELSRKISLFLKEIQF